MSNLPIEDATRKYHSEMKGDFNPTQAQVDEGALVKMKALTENTADMGYFLCFEHEKTIKEMDERYLAIGKALLDNDRETFMSLTFESLRFEMLEVAGQQWRNEQ